MNAFAMRRGLESGEAVHGCGSGLGREAAGLGLPSPGPIGEVGRRIGFALLGESLLAVAPKGTKRSCPYIRVSLHSTSLIPSTLRWPAYKGHPWPFTPLAASMPLAPLRADSIRPSERGVRRRLVGRAMEKQRAVSNQGELTSSCARFVGWKTAKHFPPQSARRLISNLVQETRWVSFALPILRSPETRTTASLHGPSNTAELSLSQGRAQQLVGWVQPINHGRWAPPILRSGRCLAACSPANKRSAFVSLFTAFQTTRTRVPFRRPSVGAAQGDPRHGCRARSDGTWMSLRDDPRSSTGGRGVLRSKTRMQGWPSFWLLFLGHTRKSDSPSRAKPLPQPTRPMAVIARIQSPTASRSRPLPQKAKTLPC